MKKLSPLRLLCILGIVLVGLVVLDSYTRRSQNVLNRPENCAPTRYDPLC